MTDFVNVITPDTTQVAHFHDGFAVFFNGRLAIARWQERGPAEAQLMLLRDGYSWIDEHGNILHTGLTVVTL